MRFSGPTQAAAPEPGDGIRPWVVLLLGFGQAAVTALATGHIRFAVDDGPRSPVAPAVWAFGIWFPIFVLAAAFGVWQALPANRANPLARTVGWPLAAAFLTICGWSIAVPLRLEWLAQVFLLGCWAFLAVAFLRVAGAARTRSLSAGERWFVALPIAPFLAWVTAANAVSLHAQAVRYGLLPESGTASVAVGGALLAAAIAAGWWLLRSGRGAPVQLWVPFGLTLLWALGAIAVEQRMAAPAVALLALAGAVAVAAAMAVPAGSGGGGTRFGGAEPTPA